MQPTVISFLSALLTCLMLALSPLSAFANPEAVETGRLLAILLDSGRVVVGANQALINDKDKGDKGFTPDVFEKLPWKKPILKSLLEFDVIGFQGDRGSQIDD